MERRQFDLMTRRDLLKWGVGGGVLLVSSGGILAACQAAGASPTATAPAGTIPAGTTAAPSATACAYSIPPSKVVLGNYPVFDLGAWVAAEHWGYLKELNLTLEHKVFPDERTGLSALAAGTSQLQLMGDLSLVGIAPTFPDFRNAFTPEVFMGFAPLIRPDGNLKTFEQMKQEISDPAEAKQKTCAQIQGKKWLLQLGGSHETVLDAVLECADGGLTRKDVDIVDIGPAEGATAFLRGEGDLYLGDVPNRYRLEEEGMVPLITAFDLGQKAEDYIAIVANLPWIQKQENEDTLMRLMAALVITTSFSAAYSQSRWPLRTTRAVSIMRSSMAIRPATSASSAGSISSSVVAVRKPSPPRFTPRRGTPSSPTARAMDRRVPSPPSTTTRSTCAGSSGLATDATLTEGTSAAVSFSSTAENPRASSHSRRASR